MSHSAEGPLRGEYDQSLLTEAPVTTRAQRQEGYDVDLARPMTASSTGPLTASGLHAQRILPTSVVPYEKPYYLPDTPPPNPSQTRPFFWRSAVGRLMISLGFILIVGGIVGGAVGGTVGRRKSSDHVAAAVNASSTGSMSPAVASSTSLPDGATAGIGSGRNISESGTSISSTVTEPVVGASSSTTTGYVGGSPLTSGTSGNGVPPSGLGPPHGPSPSCYLFNPTCYVATSPTTSPTSYPGPQS
ncbi:hypothetical protein GLOTRDRAFT_128840 [Gloeophyllum trabeum ATCC 11539]|uniref:Uncharacterized protein n=1 Tax=Gloeophyllum trabeum (strain ATCC 11539 / FP-39264 / Madison 617) TaxID=670483 RepID=S7RMG0_GLOTA|nr:uncharacterized protein GLOTRDRAFT_128840 [Gloeophyllum trabeum ATCC 11539]EPQ55620.1 hypothetical protein GLOTRDRAFT_128840 [Gloeophyllum trabeum ATCC 11539]